MSGKEIACEQLHLLRDSLQRLAAVLVLSQAETVAWAELYEWPTSSQIRDPPPPRRELADKQLLLVLWPRAGRQLQLPPGQGPLQGTKKYATQAKCVHRTLRLSPAFGNLLGT